jgi:hypothetical protein
LARRRDTGSVRETLVLRALFAHWSALHRFNALLKTSVLPRKKTQLSIRTSR